MDTFMVVLSVIVLTAAAMLWALTRAFKAGKVKAEAKQQGETIDAVRRAQDIRNDRSGDPAGELQDKWTRD